MIKKRLFLVGPTREIPSLSCPLRQPIRTQDFTALFSDIVSAVISNACRTALALAKFDLGFHSADQAPCGYSLTESHWVLFSQEFMYLYSDSRDFFPVWCLAFTKSFAWLTFAQLVCNVSEAKGNHAEKKNHCQQGNVPDFPNDPRNGTGKRWCSQKHQKALI